MPAHLGSFLIVDPDRDTAEILSTLCKKLRRARIAHDVAGARRVLDSERRLTGVILEEDLPDGRGTSLLKEIRGLHPMLPALVLTANTQAEVINRANRYRAEFVAKPTRRSTLRGYLGRAVAFERVPEQRVSYLIQSAVERYGLTPRETDVLAAAVAGTPRRDLADQLGTSENTMKSVVKTALRKMPHSSMEEAAREILHEALEGSSARTLEEFYDSRETPLPPGPMTIRPPSNHDNRDE